MIFFYIFLQISKSSNYYAIDFGSYYCKIGNISSMGHPQIVTNRQTKRITPTFLAFRPNRKFDPLSKYPLNKSEVMSLEHEIGNNAIEILQKRAWTGSGFFPAFIDATPSYAEQLSQKLFISNPYNYTRFGFFNLTSSFIHFYVENVYGHIPDNKWHLQVVIPSFYTVPQLQFISNACTTAGIKRVSLIRDTDAIAYYYAQMKSHMFQKEPKTYLFVDVGATSVKSYLINFGVTTQDKILVQKISYVHNDNIGGAFATSKLVEYLQSNLDQQNLTLSNKINLFELAEKAKCQLTLSNDAQVNIDFEEGVNQTINITRKIFEELIVDFIIDTVNVALQAAGKFKIDKVEIIGGSSRIPKLQQSLMKALNVRRLGKSLNADEVLTLGALYSKVNMNEGKTVVIRDLTNRPIVAARYDGITKQICNSSLCNHSLYLNKQPTEFSLIYSKRYFNKHLKTRKWSYRWKCSNDSHPNIVFFNTINADISGVAEVISNNTKSNQKTSNSIKSEMPSTDNLTLVYNFTVSLVKNNDWVTNFVDILSAEYVSQKASAELINNLEEIYYSMVKERKIRPTYLKVFCEQDRLRLEQMMKEVKDSIVDGTKTMPNERVGPLLEELKDFKYRAIKAKNMKKELKKLKSLITDLTKYAQKPFNTRHPDLDLFLNNAASEVHRWQVEFEEETKKKKEAQNFDIQKVQKKTELVQSKLKEALQIERNYLDSIPLLEPICLLRIRFIQFVNRNLWYFNLFNHK